MSQLEFQTITIKDFKTFTGSHKFDLARQPGLYYVTGKNLLNPELGANGVGKSTIWDALTWVLWGRTGRDARPAAAIQPWGKKGTTTVQLMFTRNGVDNFIYRTRNPNSLRHSVDASDSDVEIQQEDVAKILGMSEAMFRRTLVLGQFGELFLDAKPEAQAQMFNEALDLDIWNRARVVAQDAASVARKDTTVAQASMSAHEVLLRTVTADIEDAEKRSDLFETDKAARLAKLKTGIVTLTADRDKIEESPVLQPQVPNQDKSNNIRAKLNPIRTKLEVQFSMLKRENVALDNAEADLNFFKEQEKSKKPKRCEACGQPVSDAEFSKKKKAAEDKYKEVAAAVTTLMASTTALRAEGVAHNEKLKQAEDGERDAVELYDAALQAYTDYQGELQGVRAQLQRERRALGDEEATTNSAADSLARLRTRRQGYRVEQGDLKEKLAQAQLIGEQADFWVDAFREIRLSIIDSALVELEMASSRHMAMLGLEDWGIKFDTEKETQSGKVSYAFTVLLYPPGQQESVKWESYSGGESQRVQLAVAFALSEVLLSRAGLSPNIEVLDEPTRGLSADGVADLLDHLRDRALELGRAIYFVDHHSLDKGAFDATLMVEKDKKGSTLRWL